MSEKANALVISRTDNVATVTEAIPEGGQVTFLQDGALRTITAHAIPQYHKVAIAPISKGQTVLKYGEMIGQATADIAVGDHVHNHNIVSPPMPEMSGELCWQPSDRDDSITPIPASAFFQKGSKFMGYRRSDGRVGIRNNVLVVNTVGCAADTARRVAENLAGTVTFLNQNGCGESQGDLRNTRDVITGMCCNPNIYGVILIGLGCELNRMEDQVAEIRARTDKPIEHFLIQEEGGTLNTIAKATRAGMKMVKQASALMREECDVSELILGVECGGSDATSGLAANPVLGLVSEQVIAAGGTAMFSESLEMIGAEHLLARRAEDIKLSQRILDLVHGREEQQRVMGEDIRKTQPSPGNKDGGITTLEEKSLGCIHKGGSGTIREMVDNCHPATRKGLVLMDTPCYDPLSTSSKAAAGCQVIVFTTGRGNPIGNTVTPVIKVTANRNTYLHQEDNFDLDLSAVLRGEVSLEEQAEVMMAEINAVLNGKMTKSEILKSGYTETIISRKCEYC